MNPSTELTLDRPRTFRLTPSDWRSAARHVSIVMGMPVSGNRLLQLVAEEDETAMACVLWAGCRHEDPRVSTDKLLEALDERKERLRDRAAGAPSIYEDIGEAILGALRAIGVLRQAEPTVETNGAADPNPPRPSTSLT